MWRMGAFVIVSLCVSAIATSLVPLAAFAQVQCQDYILVCGDNSQGQLGQGNATNPPWFVAPGDPWVWKVGLDGPRVQAVAAGEDHSIVLLDPSPPCNANPLWGFGDNWAGCLGLSTFQAPWTLPVVSGFFNGYDVQLASAGQDYTLVWAVDGSGIGRLFSFGRNHFGQLGLGYISPHKVNIPTEIPMFTGLQVVAISAGRGPHSLVAAAIGSGPVNLYAFGRNQEGELGLGQNATNNWYATPQLVNGVSGAIRAVSAGGAHSLVLTTAGVYAFGRNVEGQLGIGIFTPLERTPTLVQFLSSSFCPSGCRGIAAGWNHSLFMCSEVVESCGWNRFGQLGLGDQADRCRPTLIPGSWFGGFAAEVAAGYWHSLVLDSTGVVYGFGGNDRGQLGYDPAVVLDSYTPMPVPNPSPRRVIAIAAGHNHNLFLLAP